MLDFMQHDFVISKILLACLVKAGTGSNNHKCRNGHGLALFLGGERTFIFEGTQKLTVSENTIVYFPTGSNYIIKEKESSDCYAINFEMPDSISFSPFAFKVKNVSTYLENFKKSEKNWRNKDNAASLSKIKSELYGILYQMQKEYSSPYKGTSLLKIQPAVDYIHENYTKDTINIAFLANLCGITTSHLRNVFIKNFGVSTLQYINNLKLNHAADLLASQIYRVREVCFLSCFHDESYFSREFKKHFDVSPREYINNWQSKRVS